jgi:hypothetical protein
MSSNGSCALVSSGATSRQRREALDESLAVDGVGLVVQPLEERAVSLGPSVLPV